MNLRLFSIAMLISALPSLSQAHATTILTKEDFRAAERISRNGSVLVSVKLSKAGKAKFKRLNKEQVNENLHSEIGGVVTDFKLREPIPGDSLEMGPYSRDDAEKVVREINR